MQVVSAIVRQGLRKSPSRSPARLIAHKRSSARAICSFTWCTGGAGKSVSGPWTLRIDAQVRLKVYLLWRDAVPFDLFESAGVLCVVHPTLLGGLQHRPELREPLRVKVRSEAEDDLDEAARAEGAPEKLTLHFDLAAQLVFVLTDLEHDADFVDRHEMASHANGQVQREDHRKDREAPVGVIRRQYLPCIFAAMKLSTQ